MVTCGSAYLQGTQNYKVRLLMRCRMHDFWFLPVTVCEKIHIPQTVLALRGSGGLSIGTGWSVAGLCVWSAPAHFCCYFTYFVPVTFTTLQRNGRSHHFTNHHIWTSTEKHHTKSIFLVSDGLWSLNGEYLTCSGWYSTKLGWYADRIWAKVVFLQNEPVLNFQKCQFFRNKSPAGCIET